MSTQPGNDGSPQRPSTANSQPTTSEQPATTSQPTESSTPPRPLSQPTFAQQVLLRTGPTSSRSPSPSSIALSNRIRDNDLDTTISNGGGGGASAQSRRPSLSGLRQPSIRLRRAYAPLPSPDPHAYGGGMPPLSQQVTPIPGAISSRARSASDPPLPRGQMPQTTTTTSSSGAANSAAGGEGIGLPLTQMPTLMEEVSPAAVQKVHTVGSPPGYGTSGGAGLTEDWVIASNRSPSVVGSAPPQLEDLDSDMVDVLDVVGSLSCDIIVTT
jgi:hypothetical protein